MNSLVVPSCFNLDELPSGLQLYADEARYLLHVVGRKHREHGTQDRSGYFNLQSKILRQVIDVQRLPRHRDALVNAGLIEVDKQFRCGQRSMGYRLTRRCLGTKAQQYRPVDPGFLARWGAARLDYEAEQHTRRQSIHERLEQAQQGLTLSGDPGQVLDACCPHARFSQTALLDNLRDRTLPFSVGSTGRVYNAITGLKRELRPLLRLDGEPLGSVDLCSSQPALLALLMRTGLRTSSTPSPCMECPVGGKGPVAYSSSLCVGPLSCLTRSDAVGVSELCLAEDFRWFESSVVDGSFYGSLGQEAGLVREAVKRRVLVDVLARDYASLVSRAFGRRYPTVARYIREVNRSNPDTLIRELQALEARLVVHTVAPRLVDRIPIITLHDAIFCRAKDLDIVETVFREVFDEIGFEIRLKRETWEAPTVTVAA